MAHHGARPQLVQSASLAGDMRCFPRITKVIAFKPFYLFARTAYLPFNELPKGRNGRSNVIQCSAEVLRSTRRELSFREVFQRPVGCERCRCPSQLQRPWLEHWFGSNVCFMSFIADEVAYVLSWRPHLSQGRFQTFLWRIANERPVEKTSIKKAVPYSVKACLSNSATQLRSPTS